jgi:multiple sugar transport system substrate-binding protein
MAGEIYGLPYFTSIQGALEGNLVMLEEAGVVEKDGDTYVDADKADWPKTYDDLFDDIREFKANGISDTPYLPFWFHDFPGIGWGWSSETMNRGCELVDPDTLEPTWEADGCFSDILAEHKTMLDEGLVPEGILTAMESDLIDWFATGKYVYTRQQTYDCFNHNDPGRSQIAGHCIWIPPADHGAWGLFMLGYYGSPYTWTDKLINGEWDDSVHRARQLRHHRFNGYKDKNDTFLAAKLWVERQALGSGFPEVQLSEDTVNAYMEWLPKGTGSWQAEHVIDDLFSVGAVPPIWKTFWFTEWNSKALTLLQQGILGQRDVVEVSGELREVADKLHKRYG